MSWINKVFYEPWCLVMLECIFKFEWEMMKFWINWMNVPHIGGKLALFFALQLNILFSRAEDEDRHVFGFWK